MKKFTIKKSVAIAFAILLSIAAFSQRSTTLIQSAQNADKHCVALKKPYGNNEARAYMEHNSAVKPNRDVREGMDSGKDDEELIAEDFSLFLLGTEDEPDTTTPLAGADYYIDPAYTQQPGWSGYAVYQAGQTCAITDGMNGLLNTPERELAGTITVSFRIKLLPGETVTQTLLYCSLCTNGIYNPIPVAFDAATFTHDWTDLSFTFENTESDDCFIQFKSFKTYVIDDILVTRAMTFIPAPNAQAATDYTMSGFTMQWNEVYSADDYLLTVFRKVPTGQDSVSVLEGFDGINNDGTFIDEENPNYPEGWHINLAAGNTRQVITGDGNYISAPQALCMDAIGDTIILPNNGGRFMSAYLHLKLVEYNGESGTIDFMVKRNGQWTSYLFLYLSGLYEYAGFDWLYTEMLWNPNTYEDIAIVYNSTGNAVVAFDDVEYKTTPPTQTEYMYQDMSVGDTVYIANDLDPAFDYYYYVKAHNSQFTSITSNWIKAFGLAAPIVEEATEITESSYQANWQVHPKADRYEVHNYDVFTTPGDEEDYVVLFEDFSLVQNGRTPENPIYDENIDRHRLDEYTLNPDWFGTSTIYADGMVGAGYSEYILGGITSPEMSLENNSTFHVSTKIYCTQGETVALFNSADRHEITFNQTGFQNIELDFATGEKSDRDRLRIYALHGYNFLIDQITITQDISAGDKLYQMVSWNELDGGDNDHYVFDGLWQDENHSFAYDLYAVHTTYGNDYWSDVSERIDVSISTGLGEVSGETWSVYPNPADDKLVISCDELKSVSVFNVYGQLMVSTERPEINTSDFENGMYVIVVTTKGGNKETCKVVVSH